MKISKLYRLLLLSTIALTPACTNQSFDSNRWKDKGVDWWMTDFREKMVEDLIQSDTLIVKTRQQVVWLLGDSDTKDTIQLKYLIREKYSSNIDPDYVSYLMIQFDSSGYSTKCYIEK